MALASASLRRPQSLDDPEASIRKLHVAPTPRCGGIAISAGFLIGALALWMLRGDSKLMLLLAACTAPGFAGGLIDDFTRRGGVLLRLVLSVVSAGLIVWLLDARVTRVDVYGLDALFAVPAIAVALTLLGITGLTHATNVVDGLNGLAGFWALLTSLAIAIVAGIVGDPVVSVAAYGLAAAVGGFLVVNFPRGRIFLGDGGAYFVGLSLAALAILLVGRNATVSPWFPAILFAYPVWETMFSMYRRKQRGRAAARADALHLHSLVYRRVVRWHGYAGTPGDHVRRNSIASLVLWTIPAICSVVALVFWDESLALQVAVGVFVLAYLVAYACVVRFHVPRWLVIRAGRAPAELEGDAAEV